MNLIFPFHNSSHLPHFNFLQDLGLHDFNIYRNIVYILQFASIINIVQNYTNVGINSHIILLNAFSARFIFEEIFNGAAPHC